MGCAASIKRSISLGRLDDTVLPAIELKDRLKTRGGHRSWIENIVVESRPGCLATLHMLGQNDPHGSGTGQVFDGFSFDFSVTLLKNCG